jgi:hypothetical protein
MGWSKEPTTRATWERTGLLISPVRLVTEEVSFRRESLLGTSIAPAGWFSPSMVLRCGVDSPG